MRLLSWTKVIIELKKCIIVCSNCHREIHNPEAFLKTDYKTNKSLNFENTITPTGKCPCCNTDTYRTIYCSQICCNYYKRKVKRPSREELKSLIKTIPYTRIGKMFGVSDNSIRKWAKSYGLI